VIIPALPDAVVALILQYVPLKQRLGPCALVSRSWLDVAASIPPAFITAVLPQQHSCQSLHDWLTAGQRGQHITKLQIALRASTGKPRLFLPCNQLSRLQTLCLKQLDAVLCSSKAATGCCSSSSSSAAVQDAYGQAVPSPAAGVALLPQLRQLQLLQCRISLATLQLLSQLTSLTSLELQGLQVADHMDSTTPVSTAQLSTALTILQEMPRLSDLSLGTSAWEMVPVHIPGSSPSLQRLALTGGFARRSLAGLPASLTCLQLHPSSGSCLHLRAATGLTELASSLRHLQLTKATIPAALLAKLTALQHLSMSSAWAVCAEPGDVGNADELWGYRRFGNSRVKPLLAALQQLPHLQHLVLEYQNSSETLATLTAATQLTAFELAEHGMPFESGALQKAIGSKALPQLRLLRLAAEQRGPSVRPGLHSWDHRDKPSCINDHDIRSITKSCPNLKHLVLHGVVGTNVSTGCLQSLSGLRHLTVSGAAFKDSAAAAVAQIHSLRSLVWGDSPLTVAGLQRLTGLQGLTRLEVVRCPAIDGSCSTAIVCGGTEEDQQGAAGKLVLLCEAQVSIWWVCHDVNAILLSMDGALAYSICQTRLLAIAAAYQLRC